MTAPTPRLAVQHLRVLEKRRNYLLTREVDATIPPAPRSFMKQERVALDVALAELTEVLLTRLKREK